MECAVFKRLVLEGNCRKVAHGSEIQNHAAQCPDCARYLLLEGILLGQENQFEKAPDNFVFNVQRKIRDARQPKKLPRLSDFFRPLAKPALAFSVLALAAVVYMHIKNSPVGVIENLVDRFNISELKDIKTGDVLYVSKQIHVDCALGGNALLHMDSNTVIQVLARDKISLFRGQFFLSVGNHAMTIETPNGHITLKNAKTKIWTAMHEEKGVLRAQTVCSVLSGSAEIVHVKDRMLAGSGQEIVLSENGVIERKCALSDGAIENKQPKIPSDPNSQVYTAKEQLCDCLYDRRYELQNNQLHGKELKENKFPVRVFWQNKIHFESMRRFDEAFCYSNAGLGVNNVRSGSGVQTRQL